MPTDAVQVSFEFFPPNDEAMEATLWQSIQRLAPLRPRFVSVTYGADGSTRDRTFAVVKRIMAETRLTPAPHLTCVGTTRADIAQVARQYWDAGVRHMVALRGDPPAAGIGGAAVDTGLSYAVDLVRVLKSVADFEITVAAYPEVHPEASSPEADLENLRAKVDAGATVAITQFSFVNDHILRFRDRCRRAGIEVRLVPGILPITRFPQMLRFADRCGAQVPLALRQRFEGLDQDAETRRLIAAAYAIDQVDTLRREGFNEFHFYTLNRSDLTYAICHALGVRPL